MSIPPKTQEKPPKPRSPQTGWSRWRRLLAYRDDMFLALPAKLYRAKMAEVRTPFFKSFLVNDLAVQKEILESPAERFPKSPAIYGSLEHLLRESIFVTNNESWAFQRRIIDPAFKGGRIKIAYPSMQDATRLMLERLHSMPKTAPIEMEFECSFFASDVIFRTMFSKEIEHHLARQIFDNFQIYQRAQPVWNFQNILRMPKWVPRFYSRKGKKAAQKIHQAIGALVDERLTEIEAGTAPDDLVTNILTRKDKTTGQSLSRIEAIGNIATFFIAGHETSATALAWALYMLAIYPEEQAKLYEEVKSLSLPALGFKELQGLDQTRKTVFETLRLYPPVPMLVREAAEEETFRERAVKPGDWCIASPWYSGRHEDIWERADEFIPSRWDDLPEHCRAAYFPFSKGPRICTGAGFAQTELLIGLASLIKHYEFKRSQATPIPVGHLTIRALDGIYLELIPRF